MDTYSRYLVAQPTPGATSKDAVQAFLHCWVLRYGAPARLHSDKGTHFTSTVFTQMCKNLGMNKLSTDG